MSWWKSVGHRIGYLLQQSRADADLAAEVRLHVELRARRSYSAAVWIRNTPSLKRNASSDHRSGCLEDVRQAWRFSWIEHPRSHLRYGLRQMQRNPGFAVIVIGTLGLGV